MADNRGYGPLAMLPKPSLTLTVPSLHDGLPIDCRVYHPVSLAASPEVDASSWLKHAAVIAHPYAPLGGCYDDPIVDIVAGTLLRLGFLVTTFNFRGAHGSAGRTSWTAKAERGDYMAIVGFVFHYVHFLDPFRPASAARGLNSRDAIVGDAASAVHVRPPTPDAPGSPVTDAVTPILLLGGYSYGAMITSQLPPLDTITALFATPAYDTPAAETRLRAQHLAEMQNTVLASARQAAVDHLTPKSPGRHVGVRVGGDEHNRKSHEFRRSVSVDLEEAVRHGVAELVARTRKRHKRSRSGQKPGSGDGVASTADQEHDSEHLLPIPGRITVRPAYLLVSPLQGIVTHLATMSLLPTFSNLPGKVWTRLSAKASKESAELETPASAGSVHAATAEAETELIQNTTLAIYGDRDGFVPARKLRAWASRLESAADSKFRAHEVSGADHFWAEGSPAITLRAAVKAFGAALLEDTKSTLK